MSLTPGSITNGVSQSQHWSEMMEAHMTNSDKLEFLGQIIDIFEDFLDEKGVKIDNPRPRHGCHLGRILQQYKHLRL